MLLKNSKSNSNDDIKAKFSQFKTQIQQSGQNPQAMLDNLVQSGKVTRQQLNEAVRMANLFSWLIK